MIPPVLIRALRIQALRRMLPPFHASVLVFSIATAFGACLLCAAPLRALPRGLDQPDVSRPIGDHFAELSPETQGDLLMVRHQYSLAIDAYRRGPHESAVIWNKMGVAYQHMYALDFARLQYEKSLSIDPNYADALNNLGTVFYGQQNYRKAEKFYRRAIHVRQNVACFYSNLGTAYFAERKYRQGVTAYQQALAIDPKVFADEATSRIDESGPPEEEARLNYALARLLAQAGEFDAAMRCLRAAFIHGFDDRKRVMEDKELAGLRETPAFHLFMAEEHWEN
ncbi:tetratricopeptide repeat protein [Silvibacterium sp.]|uniref:tetratricopeptide repeat protein n=1 Tax=Silvibacterium sp. TaxID=1964179 RepID=UPI0039E4A535